MDLPIPSLSIIVFILTFCDGYLALHLAGYVSGRLPEWFELDIFDKTIWSFVVGGFVALISFAGLGADVLSLLDGTAESYNLLMDWLSRNIGMLSLVEIILTVTLALVISMILDRNREITLEYVS